MNNPRATASARAMAAEKLLDRGYGKPPQLNTPIAREFWSAADMTDVELLDIIAAARAEVAPVGRTRGHEADHPARQHFAHARNYRRQAEINSVRFATARSFSPPHFALAGPSILGNRAMGNGGGNRHRSL